MDEPSPAGDGRTVPLTQPFLQRKKEGVKRRFTPTHPQPLHDGWMRKAAESCRHTPRKPCHTGGLLLLPPSGSMLHALNGPPGSLRTRQRKRQGGGMICACAGNWKKALPRCPWGAPAILKLLCNRLHGTAGSPEAKLSIYRPVDRQTDRASKPHRCGSSARETRYGGEGSHPSGRGVNGSWRRGADTGPCNAGQPSILLSETFIRSVALGSRLLPPPGQEPFFVVPEPLKLGI